MPINLFARIASIVRRATSRDHEPTGFDLAHIPARWREAGGEGVRVLVIDTGAPTHRDLVPVIDYEASESFLWREGIGDENGHATHVCSVLHDWAPKARIVCYRVAGADGKADYSAVRTALETAARLPEDMRPHVVNISLSAKNGASKWRNPICRLYRSGVPVFCGAGNDGEGGVGYPAKFPEAVAVGAVDAKGNVCAFSAKGAEVDCCYPGEGIRVRERGGGWRIASGTSLACPAAAGAAALYLSEFLKWSGKTDLREFSNMELAFGCCVQVCDAGLYGQMWEGAVNA